MPTPLEMHTEAVRATLAESAATSPIYDTDTLAGLIVTAVGAAGLEVAQASAPEAADENADDTASRDLASQINANAAAALAGAPTS